MQVAATCEQYRVRLAVINGNGRGTGTGPEFHVIGRAEDPLIIIGYIPGLLFLNINVFSCFSLQVIFKPFFLSPMLLEKIMHKCSFPGEIMVKMFNMEYTLIWVKLIFAFA